MGIACYAVHMLYNRQVRYVCCILSAMTILRSVIVVTRRNVSCVLFPLTTVGFDRADIIVYMSDQLSVLIVVMLLSSTSNLYKV